jgi:hypothetical protein
MTLLSKTVAGAAVAGAAAVAATKIEDAAWKELVDKIKGIAPKRSNFGNLAFPSDLNGSYYFALNFSQYSRSSILEIGATTPLGVICLPIPNNLADSQSVEYGEEALGTALGGSAEALSGAGVTGEKIAGVAGSMALGGIQNALGGTAGALASAMTGVQANPFMTVFFKNPNYKSFEFSWRLTPRSQAESVILANIIKTIRNNILPSKSNGFGGALLTYPSLAQVHIKTKDGELFPFKYAVIKNATFNYAPDGAPSFYKDGYATSIDIKISMQEIEYFLSGDY